MPARTYSSNEALFQHIRELITELQKQGHPSAAESLAEGLSAINGLTDGWALFMESVDHVIQSCGDSLQPVIAAQLEDVLGATRKVVFRGIYDPKNDS